MSDWRDTPAARVAAAKSNAERLYRLEERVQHIEDELGIVWEHPLPEPRLPDPGRGKEV